MEVPMVWRKFQCFMTLVSIHPYATNGTPARQAKELSRSKMALFPANRSSFWSILAAGHRHLGAVPFLTQFSRFGVWIRAKQISTSRYPQRASLSGLGTTCSLSIKKSVKQAWQRGVTLVITWLITRSWISFLYISFIWYSCTIPRNSRPMDRYASLLEFLSITNSQ